MSQFLANQRQMNEFTIFIAITDDGAAFWRQRQYRHQLGLGARFKPDRDVFCGDNILNHGFLLVHLNRIKRGVAALIIQRCDALIKSAGELLDPRLQNIRETHQQR